MSTPFYMRTAALLLLITGTLTAPSQAQNARIGRAGGYKSILANQRPAPPLGPTVNSEVVLSMKKSVQMDLQRPDPKTLPQPTGGNADWTPVEENTAPQMDRPEEVVKTSTKKEPVYQTTAPVQALRGLDAGVQAPPQRYIRDKTSQQPLPDLLPTLREDWSQVFITTYGQPTQEQALRIAGRYLGRRAQASEITLHGPSEGFVLQVSGALAQDAAARAKARAAALVEEDVVTITPSLIEPGHPNLFIAGHVLINADPNTEDAMMEKKVRTLGAEPMEVHDQQTIRVYVTRVPKGADPRTFASDLKKERFATEVLPNLVVTLHHDRTANDPLYSTQWFLEQTSDVDIDAEMAWDLAPVTTYAQYVVTSVVDGDGTDIGHEDWGSYLYYEYDATNDDADPSPESANEKHGTSCAGLVGCSSNNSVGVASVGYIYNYVTPIRMGYSQTSTGGFQTSATIMSRVATRVIFVGSICSSHSYSGGAAYFSSMQTYFTNMRNNPRSGKGAVFCASAGNDNTQNDDAYPAGYSFAVTVGATTSTDAMASFSNYGNSQEVAAPGVSTRTLDRTGSAGYDATGYTYFGGTSAACPITAGVIGLIGRLHNTMSADSLQYFLYRGCEKVGTYAYGSGSATGHNTSTWNERYGYGRINARNSVALALGYTFGNSGLTVLGCDAVVNSTTVGLGGEATKYYGSTWNETGPDKTYSFVVNQRGYYSFTLSNLGANNLDLFLMSDEWTSSTIAFGNTTISEVLLEQGTYYLNVDGRDGASGTFTLTSKCVCVPHYSVHNCTDFIKSVRFNSTVFDSSGCANNDFHYQKSPTYWYVYNGQNNFEIHSGPTSQNYLIFIDMDNDGDFEAGELVYSTNTNTTKLVGSFSLGSLSYPLYEYRRMRIISSWSDFASTTNSCPSLSYGETEDHLVYFSGQGWPVTFGAANDDYVKGVVSDATGNVYVSLSFRGNITLNGNAFSSTSTSKRDMILAKFNGNGYLLWAKKVGNGSFDMEPQGVNVDGSGNPYWAGSFAGAVNFPNAGAGVGLTALGSYDAFTARFDPATGNCVWAKRVGGSGNDYLYGCFVSNSGNVYAGGSYTGAIVFNTTAGNVNLPNAGGLDGFIVKFDPSGNGLWASRMGSTANDEVKSIEYNGGDLVACGYMGDNCTFPLASGTTTLGSVGDSRDGFAGRINSTGQFVWVKNFGSIFNDEATSICIDPSTGNVFVAAQVADAPVNFNAVNYAGAGGNDIMVLGWNFYTQAPIWARRVGSTTGDSPSTIRWDGNRLVVAGYAGGNVNAGAIGTLGTHGVQDAILLRYDKTSGAISSGLMIGGTGDDRALTMYCNPGNREEFVGGVMSNLVTFYTTTPRQSAGLYDGFVSRHFPPSGAREAVEEEATLAMGNAFKVYPVPASKELRVLLTEVGDASPEVYDMHGFGQRGLLVAPPRTGKTAPMVYSTFLA